MSRTLKVAAPVGALVAGLVLVPAAPSSAWGLTDVATLAPAGTSVVLASDPKGDAAAAWVTGGQVQVARRSGRAPRRGRRRSRSARPGSAQQTPTSPSDRPAWPRWCGSPPVTSRWPSSPPDSPGEPPATSPTTPPGPTPTRRSRSVRPGWPRSCGRPGRRQHDHPVEDRERDVDQFPGRADPTGHRHVRRVVARPQRRRGRRGRLAARRRRRSLRPGRPPAHRRRVERAPGARERPVGRRRDLGRHRRLRQRGPGVGVRRRPPTPTCRTSRPGRGPATSGGPWA